MYCNTGILNRVLCVIFLLQVTLMSYDTLHDPAGVNGLDSASLSSKIETPNVKKRHRRMKSSGNKNAECEGENLYIKSY